MQSVEPFSVRRIRVGPFARLLEAVPELGLRAGDVGVVRAVLPGLEDAYEAEFHWPGHNTPIRALLLGRQLEPASGPLITEHDVARYHAW